MKPIPISYKCYFKIWEKKNFNYLFTVLNLIVTVKLFNKNLSFNLKQVKYVTLVENNFN